MSLRQDLPERFPELFAGRHEPVTRNLMGFGMAVDDGWLPLIEAACEAITAALNMGPLHNVEERPRFVQIKEKFGTLRLYLDGPELVHRIARFACSLSNRFCEVCGAPGRASVRRGYYQTLCPAHANEQEATMLGPDHFRVPRIWDAPPSRDVLQARYACFSATRMLAIPPGWFDVLDALGEEQDRRGSGATCRQIDRSPEGAVRFDWPGINDEGLAALGLLEALLPKLDPVTGALPAPEARP